MTVMKGERVIGEVDGCGKTRVICESGCEATYIKRSAYRDTGRFIPWSPTPI